MSIVRGYQVDTNKSFEEALGDLISHYAETKRASNDEIVSAMELQIMALNEEGRNQ